ncbi:MAG: peptidylprolyl isomerase [Cytophagales bacterium]
MKVNKILFLVCSILYLNAQTQVLLDKIVAKIDNQIVLKSELELAVLQQIAMGSKDGEQLRCETLENLITNKVLLAKAEIDSVVVEEKVVEDQMNRRMQYFIQQIGSEKKLEEYYNKSIDQLKADMRRQVKDQMIVQKYQDKLTGKEKASPREIEKYFNAIPKDSLPFFSKEVVVGQIVKVASVDKEQKYLTKRRLEEYRQRILKGEDFCEFTKYSEDVASARNCGSLGFFKRGELVPEYEAAAMKLKPNEISEVIESEFGFHLIQLIERRGNEYSSRHILLKPSSSGINVNATVQFMDSLRNALLKDSIKFGKAAHTFSDDKITKENGGIFTDAETGSSRVPMDKLEPGIFFTVDTMKTGAITHPIIFTNEEGKQAVRIIYLKEVIPAHVANLKDDYQKIASAANSKKKGDVVDKWFAKAKNEVFIKIEPEYQNCNILKAE